ncbi:hypothetical protein GBA52_022856 [Prunus armeniaca]|nr:hypothetical protein GBA52_022856 [Prunus armeniaca]
MLLNHIHLSPSNTPNTQNDNDSHTHDHAQYPTPTTSLHMTPIWLPKSTSSTLPAAPTSTAN